MFHDLLARVRAEVSGEKALDMVRALTRHHRVQASPGFDAASEWLARQLEAAGLRVEIEHVPGDGRTRCLGALMPQGWECRHGEAWLDEIVGYLDESRRLLAGLLSRHLPGIRYRPPDGTYLAWFDCAALDLPGSPGELVTSRAQLTVVDGPAFGEGGAGSFRFNFATPQPILAEMVERIAAALSGPA